MTKIYTITLDIKHEGKMTIEESISVDGNSLTEVLAKFPMRLHKYLKEKHEAELSKLGDDDVPF